MKRKFEVGDRVRVKDNNLHTAYPQFYPERGTVGTIEAVDDFALLVQWPTGSTSGNDRWGIAPHRVEKVKEGK